MKRRISAALLSLCLLMSLMPSVAFAAPNGTFDDVDGHWGQSAVERWAGYGVVNGDGSGNFNPDNQMTRAEFATMLANMLGYKEKAANTFADVNEDDWFADAILKLAAAGVMQGSNGMANPNAPITRQEAAVLMCRAFNIPTTGGNLDFADSADVAEWAKGAVAALADRGMMNGVGNNNVAPLADINRASVATLLDNMITEYVTEDKTITGEVSGIVLVAADATVTVEDATLNENLIVAPKADGAEVTLTGTTTASDVVVGAAATVKVDSNATAGEVQVGAANSTVEVAGKADAVTVDSAANNTAVNVTESAAVGDVALNAADTKVSVAENATVSNVAVSGSNANVEVSGKVDNVTVSSEATGTGITANSGATVGKVETSANDVTVSGSGKVENVTANDGTVSVTTPGTSVENKTDSADNVTNNGTPVPPTTGGDTPTPPSGNSGNSGGPTTQAKKYNVSIASATGGTVTAAIAGEAAGATGTDTAGKTVTLTVTPNAQNGTTMPYVLKSLTVKNGDTVISTTNGEGGTKTFTMSTEGTYTVTPEFYQPITKAAVLHVNGTAGKTISTMYEYGYPQNPVGAPVDDTKLAETDGGYLFVGAVKANDTLKETVLGSPKVKFNGAEKSVTWGGDVKNWGCVYINGTVDNDPNAGTPIGFTEDFATIEVTFTFEGASYTLTTDYTKKDANPADKITVTLKGVDGTTVNTMTTSKGTNITLPDVPAVEGWYTTGKWLVNNVAQEKGPFQVPSELAGSTLEIKAEGVKIGTQTAITRPAGPATGATGDFDYDAAYKAAGLTFVNNTIKVNGPQLLTYSKQESDDLAKLEKQIDTTTYVFYGVQFTKPTVDGTIAKLAVAANANDLRNATAVTLTDGQNIASLNGCDVLNGNPIQYYNVATVSGDSVTSILANHTWDAMYFKWMDSSDKVLAVTQVTIKREVTQPFTVTFKNGDTTVATEYADAAGKVEAPEAPTKAGYTFAGWLNGSTPFDCATGKITANTTLTASWKSAINIGVLDASAIETAFTDWSGVTGSNMAITLTADSGKENSYTAGGSGLTAYKWSGFGTKYATMDSYYAVFKVDLPSDTSGVSADKVIVRAGIDQDSTAFNLKKEHFTDGSNSCYIAMLVGTNGDGSETAAQKAKTIDIYVKWDGMEEKSVDGATHYVINLPDSIFKTATNVGS